MTKTLILVIVASQLITMALSAAVTCKDHPAFSKAKWLLTDSVKDDEKGKLKGESLQKQYLESTPQVLTADDLGVCGLYKGEQTCCSKSMVQFIDNAAFTKVKAIQQKKDALHKLIVSYHHLLNKKCDKNNIVNASVEDILNNKDIPELVSAREKQKECKIKFGKAIAGITRGAMCTICSGVDKISNEINGKGQLIINAKRTVAFQTDSNEAIQCFNEILQDNKIEPLIGRMNHIYIKDLQNSCSSDIMAQLRNVFKNSIQGENNGKQKCNAEYKVFGDNNECQKVLEGSDDLESKGSARLLRIEMEEIVRLLQVADDKQLDDIKGLDVYLSSQLDQKIDYNGATMNADFDSIEVGSSGLKLVFITFFTLLALLI